MSYVSKFHDFTSDMPGQWHNIWGHLVPSFMESSFPTSLCFFLALVFWSVNCTSLVYKLYLTFQTCQGTKMSRQFIPGMSGNWVNIYIWGILVLPFMESWISTFQYFSSFFYLVCELPKSLFQLIFVNQ